MYFKLVTVLCLFFVHRLASGSFNEKDLWKHLYFTSEQPYSKIGRPVLESQDAVPVQVQLKPIMLREVDDTHHMFTLDTWLAVQWKDQFLKWEPGLYGGLQEFRLPANEVWLPDLAFYTGTPDSSHLPVNTNVVVSSGGDMSWVPSLTLKNRCSSLRYRNLKANCTISLVSWSYDITQLDINIKNETSLEHFEKGFPGWYVESATSERVIKRFSCCPKPYPVINFNITLRRTVF